MNTRLIAALKREDQTVESIRAIALQIASAAKAIRACGPDNYEVQCYNNPKTGGQGWGFIAGGTREHCTGYATACTDRTAGDIYRVVCNGVIVWPEEKWLEPAEQYETETQSETP